MTSPSHLSHVNQASQVNRVSCLCITQPGRARHLTLAVNDFVRQTHADRELVIVHDGDDFWDHLCRSTAVMAADRSDCAVLVHRVAAGHSLGELRNIAVDIATGEWICQWDDDDRYHPRRLELQHAAALDTRADAVFMTQQLHLFVDSAELILEDWQAESYPSNVVQGSLFARRLAMPRYDPLRRGEDTAMLFAITRSGLRVTRLSGVVWAYAYTFHGSNTWDAEHHRAGAEKKMFSPAATLNHQGVLLRELRHYEPPLLWQQPASATSYQQPDLPGTAGPVVHTHCVVPPFGAFALCVAAADRMVGAALADGRTWEPELAQLLVDAITPGDTVIDVGANLGYFTLLMSRAVGKAGRVVAIEPEPRNLVLLKHNSAVNNCHNVSIVACAASDHEGEMSLAIDEVNWGNHQLLDKANADGTCIVRTVRLDDLLPEAVISCIKIDVQGHETRVLNGARALIERSRNQLLVICEFEPQYLRAAAGGVEGFIDVLQSLGASAWLVEWHGNRAALGAIPELRTTLLELARLTSTRAVQNTMTLALTFSEAATRRLYSR